MAAITATYFNDPGCPWGYSFRPAHARLVWRFGDQIDWRLVLVGLAEDADELERRGLTPARAAVSLRDFQRRWGMPFRFAVKPLAGTSRACRAIVAVRQTAPERADAALRAMQLLHFATPGRLDDDRAIRDALASVAGVDADRVVALIDDRRIVTAYEADRALARSAEGTPPQAQGRTAVADGSIRYTAPSVVFSDAQGRRIEVGGFQPFEVYDTALANLEPGLERRPAPADAAEALAGFPDGLTTAEVASVLRASDLDAIDIPAAAAELADLAAAGKVACVPMGSDALWLAPGSAARGRAHADPAELARVAA